MSQRAARRGTENADQHGKENAKGLCIAVDEREDERDGKRRVTGQRLAEGK